MNKHVAIAPAATYSTDLHAWSLEQARLLRNRRFDRVDVANIAEEIEDLARSDEREAVNRLKVIVEHLLKLMLSTATEPRQGWRESIATQRDDLDVVFGRSPSLRARRAELYAEAWPRGVKLARTGLRGERAALAELARLGLVPAFDIDIALDDDFFPGD